VTRLRANSGAHAAVLERGVERQRKARGVDARGQPPAPGQLVAGVFKVDTLLGMGAGGSVYRVKEADSGRVRALKVFAHAANVEHTLHEFRVLSRLKHPGCVKVHAFGHDPRVGAYLVMDLVEGAAPTEVLPGGQSAQLLAFAQHILETLAYLHSRGVIHGDLKPDNIRCIDGDATQPVLLDFGLASTHEADPTGGTILYMAPELFRRQPRDARTDLYALGIMLYEIATGAPPYEGASDIQVTRRHLAGRAAPLSARHTQVSAGLSRFVARLMSRQAGDRPSSASEALAELAELTGVELVTATVGVDPAMAVSAPALVHRDHVLDAFDKALQAASGGHGGMLVLHGPPGSGRTRILDELDVRGRLSGARIVRWNPLREPAANAISDAVLGFLSHHSSGDMSGLVDGLHRLGTLQAGTPESSQQPVQGETAGARLAEIALDVLDAAARRYPVVMLVDDVTAGGPHVGRLLGDIARALSRCRVLLVAACAHDSDIELGRLEPDAMVALELTPLDEGATAELLRTAIGDVVQADQTAQWLREESGGNLSATVELVRWLVETGVLARRKGRWHLSAPLETLAKSVADLGMRTATRRLASVPPELRSLLQAFAVMGQEFDPEIAAGAFGIPDPDDELLHSAIRSRIVEPARQSVWRLRFVQPATRRVLSREVPADRRREIHTHLADQLLGEGGDRGAEGLAQRGILRDVAWHLLGAGDWQSGVPLARHAARRARKSLAIGEAEALYRRALGTLEGRPEAAAARAMILGDLGDLHMDADRPESAVDHYEASLRANEETGAAETRHKLGHALVRVARYDVAIVTLTRVIEDQSAPETLRARAAHDVGWAHMLRSDWTAALSAAGLARELAVAQADRRLEAQVLKLRGNVLWHQGRWKPSLAENESAFKIYEEVEDTRGAADALMQMGTAHRHLTEYDDAIHCYKGALERFKALGMRRGVGKCQNNIAIVHYYRGAWPAATRRWEAFLRVLERTGERIERVSLLNNLGSLYRERGLFERAEKLLIEGLELARELGARRHEAMLLGNLGDTLLRAGRFNGAQQILQDTVDLSLEINAEDEALEARRRLFELRAAQSPGGLDVVAVERDLKRAGELSLTLEQTNLLRLLAAHHRVHGGLDLARSQLDQAEKLAESSGAALELLRVRRERALLLAKRGENDKAVQLLNSLDAEFEAMDASWDRQVTREALRQVNTGPDAALSAGHLETIATFCQELGGFEDPRQFLHDALERLMDLTGADRGFICLFDASGQPSLKVVKYVGDDQSSRADRLFSRTITRDAFNSDDPIYLAVTADADKYRDSHSVVMMDLRTVLAAPIRSARRRRGVIYLDSKTPGNETLRRAVPLLSALSSVIGASLDHAELLDLERSRNETMAMLAHELRGPLNGIYAHLELTREQEDRLPAELREYLQVASGELLRLNRMIGNLTDVARLEHHSSHNTVVSLDMGELLSTVVANLSSLSAAQRQIITLDIGDGLPFALGSRDRIIQVVTNLMTNAIKFSPDEGAIYVAARLVEQDQHDSDYELGPEVPPSEFLSTVQAHVSEIGLLEISVVDSGPGVPKEAQETIFAKFRQTGAPRDRKSGLGLGLAISRHIIERHGGRIWCENVEGIGAAFRFTLPTLEE
jgi:signal transduction histidine kinase/tetratricopeptide (TPR) repeat protein